MRIFDAEFCTCAASILTSGIVVAAHQYVWNFDVKTARRQIWPSFKKPAKWPAGNYPRLT